MSPQRKYNFLVADDEQPIIKIISDILAINPHTSAIFSATDGEKAFHLYENNKIDIVIADILMPRLSGMDLIKKMKEKNPNAHIIMVSAYNNIDLVREAIRNGAYDYIIKPFSVDEIMFSVNRVIDRLKLLEEKENYVSSLEKKIQEARDSLQVSFFDTLATILNMLEARDRTTLDHCRNTSEYSVKISKLLGLDNALAENIRIGGQMHDIGKIGIPDSVLLKPGALNKEESDIIRKHCVFGRDIVMPLLNKNQDILDCIYYHHERFDGKGYPKGLAGEKIPLAARIVTLANSYVAMTTPAVYKKAMTKEQAIEEIKANSGTQFDPKIAGIFIEEILLKDNPV